MRFLLFIFIIILSTNLYSKIIITSIYPIKNIIKSCVPENYKILYIIPIGANPHIYEPTTKNVLKIKKGNIFIGVSKEFDGWIEKFLSSKTKVYYLINKKNINPHIWLSPKETIKKIKVIKTILCKNDPKNCNVILQKSNKFQEKLKVLYSKLFLKVKNIKNKNIIQFHPAWDYFANDFGFKIIGTISKEHGVNASFKKYYYLINKAKKYKVKFIWVGFNGNSNIINNFSKAINGKIIRLNIFGKLNNDYFDLLKENIKKISKEK